MRLIDDNGVPTVAGARLMFDALDEARVNREWREAERARQKHDEHIAMRAAHLGIPLACAGDIGFTMGGTRHGRRDVRSSVACRRLRPDAGGQVRASAGDGAGGLR